jgi:tetratricopeptide (TPR) repeat protein
MIDGTDLSSWVGYGLLRVIGEALYNHSTRFQFARNMLGARYYAPFFLFPLAPSGWIRLHWSVWSYYNSAELQSIKFGTSLKHSIVSRTDKTLPSNPHLGISPSQDMQTAGASKPCAAASPHGTGALKRQTNPRRTTHVPQAAPPRDNQLAAGLLGAAAALTLALAPPSFAVAEPFLRSTGARGPLAAEEEELLRLRAQSEEAVREELAQVRVAYEDEAKRTQGGRLCATPFGIDVVGITEFIALTGALVGGVSARRRKEELERLNEQLRTINAQLRQQARAGTLYAPGLTYAPIATGAPARTPTDTPSVPPSVAAAAAAAAPPSAVAAAVESAAVAGAAAMAPSSVSLMSIDEEDTRPEVKQCVAALKEGKRLLKEQNAGAAMVRFEKALMLAKSLEDRVRERRAVRGLAAASRLSGQPRQAIKYLHRVLEISDETGDHVGDADAYGTIADCYTDMGEFEKAAEFYDRYISRMNSDGSVV